LKEAKRENWLSTLSKIMAATGENRGESRKKRRKWRNSVMKEKYLA